MTFEITTLIAAISTLVSAIIMILTYLNLRELKKSRIEESRAYIVFYIEKPANSEFHQLIIKNFGKSSGTLLEIKTIPEISFGSSFKILQSENIKPITASKNIFLAPSQSIFCDFPFSAFTSDTYDIKITYITLGKKYIESYTINNDFRSSMIKTYKQIADDDYHSILIKLLQSIQVIADRLR